MADGDYERRAGRDAELKRLVKILREMRPARKLTDGKQDKRKMEWCAKRSSAELAK